MQYRLTHGYQLDEVMQREIMGLYFIFTGQ
jgi:hypothetical protein